MHVTPPNSETLSLTLSNLATMDDELKYTHLMIVLRSVPDTIHVDLLTSCDEASHDKSSNILALT